jgi:protoheme IX farnesyltransferase
MQETTTLTTPKPSLIKEALRLGKLRLSTSVVFSSVAGYLLGMEVFSWTQLALLIFGGITVVAASNAYNQIYEKDRDALMNRTKGRPLPLGTLTLREAWFIATFLLVVGLWALYEINPMTAYFGALSVVFVYAGVHATQSDYAVSSICWCNSWCDSIHVGLGCR